MQNYSRPFATKEAVENFLRLSLQFDYTKDKKLRGIVSLILDGELGVSNFNINSQTLSVKAMRDVRYRNENDRWELRKKIIDDLWNKIRLSNDEKISLSRGGALPKSEVNYKKQAFILIGLPASGKSSVATTIADDYGAIIVDSDYAKRKLPEYKDHLYGASLVHEESSSITFGFKKDNPDSIKSLYELCIENGANMVIPKIGQNPASILELAKALTEKDKYKVHLVLVSLPKRDATIRAIYRFATTGRYVPLGLIFDTYSNDPSCCYYYLRLKHSNMFKSMGVVLTKNKPAEYTDCKGDSPVLKYQYNNLTLQLP